MPSPTTTKPNKNLHSPNNMGAKKPQSPSLQSGIAHAANSLRHHHLTQLTPAVKPYGGGCLSKAQISYFFCAASASRIPSATPSSAAKSTCKSLGNRNVMVWAGNQNNGMVFLKTKLH